MKLFFLAAAGGAIGAGGRYLVNVGVGRVAGVTANFPWPTFLANIVGSFAMGVVIGLLALKFSGSPELRTFIATGILGGFTTFSAFSADVVVLMERQQTGLAAFYAASSVVCAVGALLLGLMLVRQVLA
ncbi:MAG: fluoride efflux transporter CrcB [Hyphomicrobiaceae bacterium]